MEINQELITVKLDQADKQEIIHVLTDQLKDHFLPQHGAPKKRFERLGDRITELEKETSKQGRTLEELGDRVSELDLEVAKESAKVAKDILYLNKELGQLYDRIWYLTDQMHQISTDIIEMDTQIKKIREQLDELIIKSWPSWKTLEHAAEGSLEPLIRILWKHKELN